MPARKGQKPGFIGDELQNLFFGSDYAFCLPGPKMLFFADKQMLMVLKNLMGFWVRKPQVDLKKL